VDPDCRREGLGRRLVEAAEAWARSAGCREMASDTDPGYPLSPTAHAALGYQEVFAAHAPPGHQEGDRYFRKDLL
jgi:aminoglycoside 6'-N-acetyltransferase I